MPSKPCKKPCGTQKVCNPASGRCILKSGKLGQSLTLKSHGKSNKPQYRSKSKSHKRSKSRVKKDTKSRSRKNGFISVIIKQEHVRKLSSVTITGNNVKMSIMSMINFINPFSMTKPELWKVSFKVPKSLLNSYNASNLTEFLNNNQAYLDRLSMRERINLYGYTKAGDQLVNMYLRNDIQALEQYISSRGNYQHIPIYYQLRDRGAPEGIDEIHSWLRTKDTQSLIKIFISAIKSYIDELVKVFDNSPALTRPITVFRGVKTAYYKTDNSNVFHNREFMSASLDPDIAITFTDSTAGCCFKQINLVPGAKAIFIAPLSQEPNELEVLLPPGNKFMVSEKINTTQRSQDSTARTLSRITVLQQV